MKISWEEYVKRTRGRPPRVLLFHTIKHVKNKHEALDVGSGALNDSIFLLKSGFAHVTALDQKPFAQDIADTLPKEKFEYLISKIEKSELLPERYDLISVQFFLPFLSPFNMEASFLKLLAALKKGGVMCGQFLGRNDEWSSNLKMSFHTKESALRMLSGLEIIYFNETEEDSSTVGGGVKHWHIFDFIVRKSS